MQARLLKKALLRVVGVWFMTGLILWPLYAIRYDAVKIACVWGGYSRSVGIKAEYACATRERGQTLLDMTLGNNAGRTAAGILALLWIYGMVGVFRGRLGLTKKAFWSIK